jgi:diguanylate cyclase (GGDEF)-like protein
MISEIILKAKSISAHSPDAAIELCETALVMSRSEGLRYLEAKALLGRAFAYRVKSDVSNLLDSSLTALEIFEQLDDKDGSMRSMNLAGVAYFYSSFYEEAMRLFLNSLELSRNLKDRFLESSILNNIAEVYRETLSYTKALEYYKEAADICDAEDFDLNKAVILGNIGDIHLRETRYQQALEYFYSSRAILEAEKDIISLAEINSRIGRVAQYLGDRIGAEKQYKSALNMLEGIENRYYAIDILVHMGSLYSELRLDEGMAYYRLALGYAEKIDAKKKLIEIYKQIASQYEAIGRFKEALEYYKLYSNYNEQLSTVAMGNRLEILNVELKHTRDFNQLNLLKSRFEKELKIQKQEIQRIIEANRLLEKKASEDELTGIPNRRSINKKLHELVGIAQEDNKNVAVYMIDIDNFKKYNDCWGHSEGDNCLRLISNSISEISWERGDSFGRYGGEEFVYIARPLNIDESFELGERIRKKVEDLGLNFIEDGSTHHVTISIGGVIGRGESLLETSRLMEKADDQMYLSKANGKNKLNVEPLNKEDLFGIIAR